MIRVQDLRFTYKDAKTPTLDGLSFEIAVGEVYGLLGPSGAGKSTTQRILMGLQQGYTGKAAIFGRPVASLGRALYERIGVSFELPAVYLRLTALENLKLFAALYDRRTRDPLDVLADVDLADAADQRVEQFSKGMKMRLNLARSMLHDPDLLFLDEPTTGQDPSRARMTRDLIRKLKAAGKTIFLTTHNMAEAEEICDRVGFLSGGVIPVTGTPEELKRRYGQRLLEAAVTGPQGLVKRSFPMDGIGSNIEFLELLTSGQVVSMHTLEASLDDVFIRATAGQAEAAA
ncbi:MAG: ABC transporter ATP-binding protein [Devosia nanyangense]|uniref:ABC transporter ATP-binding protein n=1 Tax=Devosia nanyangense TaxID=1228055 RepID=A0A933NVF7_9HYPH|nr:ABC transporter ATP-binding protein [Devosia nanyangense]